MSPLSIFSSTPLLSLRPLVRNLGNQPGATNRSPHQSMYRVWLDISHRAVTITNGRYSPLNLVLSYLQHLRVYEFLLPAAEAVSSSEDIPLHASPDLARTPASRQGQPAPPPLLF